MATLLVVSLFRNWPGGTKQRLDMTEINVTTPAGNKRMTAVSLL
jgi:hypothetical protein